MWHRLISGMPGQSSLGGPFATGPWHQALLRQASHMAAGAQPGCRGLVGLWGAPSTGALHPHRALHFPYSSQTWANEMSQVPCALCFTDNLRQNSHIAVYRTEQEKTASPIPICSFCQNMTNLFTNIRDRFTWYLLFLLLVLSYQNSHLSLLFLWNRATHYLLPSLSLFFFLSH